MRRYKKNECNTCGCPLLSGVISEGLFCPNEHRDTDGNITQSISTLDVLNMQTERVLRQFKDTKYYEMLKDINRRNRARLENEMVL